jgi:hypothetical protein
MYGSAFRSLCTSCFHLISFQLNIHRTIYLHFCALSLHTHLPFLSARRCATNTFHSFSFCSM